MNKRSLDFILDPITANEAAEISLDAFLNKNIKAYNAIMNEIKGRAENGENYLKLRHIEDLECKDFLVGEGSRFIYFLKRLGYATVDGRDSENGIWLTIEW